LSFLLCLAAQSIQKEKRVEKIEEIENRRSKEAKAINCFVVSLIYFARGASE
jgi:hypothetical protein